MWDMCNHRPGRLTTDFDVPTKRVECAAQCDVAAGQQARALPLSSCFLCSATIVFCFSQQTQVTIYYGARSIAQILWFNGFVPDESEQSDFVELWLSPVPDNENDLRKQLLIAAGASHTGRGAASR